MVECCERHTRPPGDFVSTGPVFLLWTEVRRLEEKTWDIPPYTLQAESNLPHIDVLACLHVHSTICASTISMHSPKPSHKEV